MSETSYFISGFITFFQYCGLCASYQPDQLAKRCLLELWSFTHIVITIIILTILYLNKKQILYENDSVGEFLDIIQVLAPILTHLVMNLSGIIYRKTEMKIWHDSNYVDGIISGYYDVTSVMYSFLRKFLGKCILLNTFGILPELYNIVSLQTLSLQWAYNFYIRLFAFIITRIGILQYMFYVDYMTSRLKILSDLLRSNKNSNFANDFKIYHPIKMNSQSFLVAMNEVTSNLMRINENINYRFGWSLLVIIINFFICITVDLYWIIRKIWTKEAVLLRQSIACAIPPITSLVILFWSCEEFYQNGSLIGSSLHIFMRNKYDSLSANMIRILSLQIKHQSFKLTAAGFFTMDFSFFSDMISAIITYLVIFVQTIPNP